MRCGPWAAGHPAVVGTVQPSPAHPMSGSGSWLRTRSLATVQDSIVQVSPWLNSTAPGLLLGSSCCRRCQNKEGWEAKEVEDAQAAIAKEVSTHPAQGGLEKEVIDNLHLPKQVWLLPPGWGRGCSGSSERDPLRPTWRGQMRREPPQAATGAYCYVADNH